MLESRNQTGVVSGAVWGRILTVVGHFVDPGHKMFQSYGKQSQKKLAIKQKKALTQATEEAP